MKRKTTALIKDLELQIDFLISYAPSGNHWKQEYSIRKTLIDETLESENTPPEIREKIYAIQESLNKLRNKDKNTQEYLQGAEIEVPEHEFPINHKTQVKSPKYALDESLMNKFTPWWKENEWNYD